MYADRMSEAMQIAIEETDRRRSIQEAYNHKHGIVPETIQKEVVDILRRRRREKEDISQRDLEVIQESYNLLNPVERKRYVKVLESQMLEAAKDLDFERAIIFRDEIKRVGEEKTK
jgi:excinuclease ABC subunit B